MKVTILGAGAYGLALALAFYRNHNQVTVWTKILEEEKEILTTRKHEKALPGVIIPNEISITTHLECCKESDLIVLAIPINFFRSTCLELKNYVKDSTVFCIATKGIENQTNAFCHEILASIIPTNDISILSGPTFAIDLANNSFCGLTLATTSIHSFSVIKKALASNHLTIEETNDLIGTELCGSIKNIMAILAGMLEEMNATETTKALFYVQAIKEAYHVVSSLGGNGNTVYSLCGIGDLILTCTSNKSRNFTLGKMLISADKDTVFRYLENTTVEGYYTLISIYQIMKENHIDSPLIELLYQILFENCEKEKLFITLCDTK